MIRAGTLSVIIPAYNEEANIPLATKAISDTLTDAGISYRLLFVDDGSSDETWSAISACAAESPYVAGLHFSRNFGKESAIYAGICNADTECCAVIDADLQHPVEKLVEMYHLWSQGFDVIEGIKTDRGRESSVHRGASRSFYKMIGRLTGLELQNTSDFKLMDQEVATIISHLPERNTFFRAMSFWVGFRTTQVEYEVQERVSGTSKWSTWKLVRYAMNNIASFSSFPMQIVTWLGALSILFSAIFGVISFVQKLMGVALGGFTTVILLVVFIGGIIMLSLGVIGFYIAKIYSEVQHRPRFIISEECGVHSENRQRVG